jgi:hypothetical protein
MRTDLTDLHVLELSELDSRVMLCDESLGCSGCCSCCCCCCCTCCHGDDDPCSEIETLA